MSSGRTLFRRVSAALCVAALTACAATAEASRLSEESFSRPRSPLEARLFADAADGRLDGFSLLAASLIAGGERDARALEGYERQLDAWAAADIGSQALPDDPRQRAVRVLRILHEHVFTGGYQVGRTDVAAALEEGRFNCVSATVLFNCLADRFGLKSAALERPAHVLSVVETPEGGGSFEVETTCPNWFELPESAQADRKQHVIGLQGDRGDGPARRIGNAELVAMIYFNQGVEFLGRNEFRAAVEANTFALKLDPASRTARANRLAAINNWALSEGSTGRYEQAVQVLRHGLSVDPSNALLKANLFALEQERAEAKKAGAGRRPAGGGGI